MSKAHDTDAPAGLVVVGVDGSEAADAALSVALEEAMRRGCRLRVVTAWHAPVSAYAGALGPAPGFELSDLEAAAQKVLETAVARIRDAAGDTEIEAALREGHPSDVLVEESAGADLLVVGSRGLGGFTGLLLGSVSSQCAHHAHCPILIVRPESQHGDAKS